MYVAVLAHILFALVLGCIGSLWFSRGISKWKEKTRFDKPLGLVSVLGSFGVLIVGLSELRAVTGNQLGDEVALLMLISVLLWLASTALGAVLCRYLNQSFLDLIEISLSVVCAFFFSLWIIFKYRIFDASDVLVSVGCVLWLCMITLKRYLASKL